MSEDLHWVLRWAYVVSLAAYLHLVFALRNRKAWARTHAEFLRKIGARHSDEIVIFWAVFADVAAIILLFLPRSSDDPTQLYTVLIQIMSGRFAANAHPSEPSAHAPAFFGLWVVPFVIGIYFHLVWAYRGFFAAAKRQAERIRELLRLRSEHAALFVALVFDIAGIVAFIVSKRRG